MSYVLLAGALLNSLLLASKKPRITSVVPTAVKVGKVVPLAEQITDTVTVQTVVAPTFKISAFTWPAAAQINTAITGGFTLTVYAPYADVPNAFCGFINKTGNPGPIEVYVPGVGWTSIAVGNRFIAALATISKGTYYTYGPRDLKFDAAGTYSIDLIAGCIV